LFAPAAPPLEVAQLVEFQFAVFPTQYLFAAAVNVMPELPLQSPRRVPVNGEAAPAPVMSWKSTSVSETTAAVMVRVVPAADD
jgi:hypothetical protein